MRAKFFLLPLLLAPTLAACSGSGTDSFDAHINGNLHINFENGALVVHAPGHPDARIAADGDFRIGDNAVAVTPAQRDLMKKFYGEAVSVRDDGIATGKAGAALGVHALGAAVDGLLSGDSHKTDQDMQARSKVVENAAMHLCGDLKQLKATQGQLGTELPSFKPYAVFRGEIHCEHRKVSDADAQRDRIRDDIRNSIRSSIRDTARAGTKPLSASTPATSSTSTR